MTTKSHPSYRHHIHTFADACELLASQGYHVSPLSFESKTRICVTSQELTGVRCTMSVSVDKTTGELTIVRR